MRESILKNTVKACCVIFCLLIAVHAFEAIVLRMDEASPTVTVKGISPTIGVANRHR